MSLGHVESLTNWLIKHKGCDQSKREDVSCTRDDICYFSTANNNADDMAELPHVPLPV